MKDNVNTEELKEAAREAYRRLQNELERKVDEAEELKIQMRIVEATQGVKQALGLILKLSFVICHPST